MLVFLYTVLIVLLIGLIGLNAMLFLRVKTIWRRVKLAYVVCGFIILVAVAFSMRGPEPLSLEFILLLSILLIATMLSGSIVSWSKTQIAEFSMKKTRDEMESIMKRNGVDNGE